MGFVGPPSSIFADHSADQPRRSFSSLFWFRVIILADLKSYLYHALFSDGFFVHTHFTAFFPILGGAFYN